MGHRCSTTRSPRVKRLPSRLVQKVLPVDQCAVVAGWNSSAFLRLRSRSPRAAVSSTLSPSPPPRPAALGVRQRRGVAADRAPGQREPGASAVAPAPAVRAARVLAALASRVALVVRRVQERAEPEAARVDLEAAAPAAVRVDSEAAAVRVDSEAVAPVEAPEAADLAARVRRMLAFPIPLRLLRTRARTAQAPEEQRAVAVAEALQGVAAAPRTVDLSVGRRALEVRLAPVDTRAVDLPTHRPTRARIPAVRILARPIHRQRTPVSLRATRAMAACVPHRSPPWETRVRQRAAPAFTTTASSNALAISPSAGAAFATEGCAGNLSFRVLTSSVSKWCGKC